MDFADALAEACRRQATAELARARGFDHTFVWGPARASSLARAQAAEARGRAAVYDWYSGALTGASQCTCRGRLPCPAHRPWPWEARLARHLAHGGLLPPDG